MFKYSDGILDQELTDFLNEWVTTWSCGSFINPYSFAHSCSSGVKIEYTDSFSIFSSSAKQSFIGRKAHGPTQV